MVDIQTAIEVVANLRKQLLGDITEREQEAMLLLADKAARMNALLNTPELIDFAKGVQLEAAHQRERWGSEHDAGKTPYDWFWLVAHLATRALEADKRGDLDKMRHHMITTAAALANWHAATLGLTNMRPGIVPPENL